MLRSADVRYYESKILPGMEGKVREVSVVGRTVAPLRCP